MFSNFPSFEDLQKRFNKLKESYHDNNESDYETADENSPRSDSSNGSKDDYMRELNLSPSQLTKLVSPMTDEEDDAVNTEQEQEDLNKDLPIEVEDLDEKNKENVEKDAYGYDDENIFDYNVKGTETNENVTKKTETNNVKEQDNDDSSSSGSYQFCCHSMVIDKIFDENLTKSKNLHKDFNTIQKVVKKCYNDDECSLECLFDCLMLYNLLLESIFPVIKNDDFKLKFALKLRIKIKKLINMKRREGYDYVNFHKIACGEMLKMCKDDELPRHYAYVEDSETDYKKGVEEHWKPSCKKIKSLLIEFNKINPINNHNVIIQNNDNLPIYKEPKPKTSHEMLLEEGLAFDGTDYWFKDGFVL